MKAITHSPKFLKQRRFLTLLPVLVLPFITIFFTLLGGGEAGQAGAAESRPGLNLSLPQPNLQSLTNQDKLSYYEHAAKDSISEAEQYKYDPYLNQGRNPEIQFPGIGNLILGKQTPSYAAYSDPAEKQIYRKIQQLKQVISEPEPVSAAPVQKEIDPSSGSSPVVSGAAIDRLQNMMEHMQGADEKDPELSQLQDMLEKIQQIQHPELLGKQLEPAPVPSRPEIYQTIPAVIARNQKITQGTVVELRLLDTVTLQGQLIPKGHQVYGIAQLSNQRMALHIKSIGLGRAIIPVDLTVFDQRDSMEGIYVPEAVTGEAIRGGTDNAMQGLQVLTMDQRIGTQVAGAGISAAKGLFSKKVKTLKAKLSAGYPVLLKNNQQ